MSDKPILDKGGPIEPVNLRDALEERYLAYALSTIMHRALPDVRDGLKPVHRRLPLMPCVSFDSTRRGDSRNVRVSSVMSSVNFIPMGIRRSTMLSYGSRRILPCVTPSSTARGILAMSTAIMLPPCVIRKHGSPKTAQALLDGIDEDTVDFRATYDGEENEPAVLPANFPNLLANGASGIAVGMATNVPPHNVVELCTAALHLIKYPRATIDKLVELVPGPDFPTGGLIVEPRESIVEAYKTGRGSFRVRARWEKEKSGKGTYQIVVTEIPYQVQKSRLIEKIAELIQTRKLPLLDDVRDESDEIFASSWCPKAVLSTP